MIRVSAGIIRREDGRYLICRRGAGRNHAGLWEFPGGKQEAGESPESCLARELQEELSLLITVPRVVKTQEHGGILFDFVACETAGEPVLTEHTAFAWVTARQMLQYTFCPADTEVARQIALNAPKLKAFFWDFDGTLMDSYPSLVRVMLDAGKRIGVTLDPARVLDLMKDNLRHAICVIGEENGMTFEAFNTIFREEEKTITLDEVLPLPGMLETLRALKARGCRHFLLTHRDCSAWAHMDYWGMKELFDGGVTLEDGFPRKPHPESLAYLMNRYGVDPAEAVMIGDRPLDTACGRNAGAVSCLIDVEGRYPKEPAELRTSDSAQLLGLLAPEDLHL